MKQLRISTVFFKHIPSILVLAVLVIILLLPGHLLWLYVYEEANRCRFPLYKAALNGDLERTKKLLKSGSKINEQIDYKADGNVFESLNTTPIFAAISGKNEDVVKLLLANGANLEHKNIWGATPLSLSSAYDSTWIISILLDVGADINTQTNDGSTPLMQAVESKRIENIRFLLDRGANILIKNKRGETALSLSRKPEHKNSEIEKMLLDAGAKE